LRRRGGGSGREEEGEHQPKLHTDDKSETKIQIGSKRI
jgi:hypothetical protein